MRFYQSVFSGIDERTLTHVIRTLLVRQTSENPCPQFPCSIFSGIRFVLGSESRNIGDKTLVGVIQKYHGLNLSPTFQADLFSGPSREVSRNLKQKNILELTDLAELCTNFPPFWEQHRSDFLKSAVKKSRDASTAGAKGAEAKAKKNWIDATNCFIQFLTATSGKKTVSIRKIDPKTLRKNFENQLDSLAGAPKDTRTRKKWGGFIGTLLTHLHKHRSLSAALKDLTPLRTQLETEKIYKVTDETLKACLEILVEPVGPGGKRKGGVT